MHEGLNALDKFLFSPMDFSLMDCHGFPWVPMRSDGSLLAPLPTGTHGSHGFLLVSFGSMPLTCFASQCTHFPNLGSDAKEPEAHDV